MNNNTTLWRDVPGFEGTYQINIDTREGRCRSTNYNRTGIIKDLSNTPCKRDRRINWTLTKNGKCYHKQAACWIALTYPELVQNEYFEGAEIDHIDTDRMNNHPSNLRWTDRKGNANNPLTRQHKSESQKGKVFTEETRMKMSAARQNRVTTTETREKMSKSQMNRPDRSKWVIQLSLEDEILHFYPSIQQASRETGIHVSSICTTCKGKRNNAGKYLWKYAE